MAVRCLERARGAAELLQGEEREKALRYLGQKSGVLSQAGTVEVQEVVKIILTNSPLYFCPV